LILSPPPHHSFSPPPPSPATTACLRHPRPVPLPRRLGAPPSSNRRLRRSSATLDHPSNLPPTPSSPAPASTPTPATEP
jgi:hypothetical protein